MRKTTAILCIFLMFAVPALAFLSDLKILNVEEIKKLPNEDLLNVYIDAKVEASANRTFHISAGFGTPKAYEQYKELLTYIIHLRQEMEKRKLDVPPIEEWLK